MLKVPLATSAPVVALMLREPMAADAATVIGTERLVGPSTVIVPVVIFAPKLSVVLELKCVLFPVMTIVSDDPWWAEVGLGAIESVLAAVPDKATNRGLGVAELGTMVTAPTIVPVSVGANCTSSVQLFSASNTVPLWQVVPVAAIR